MGLPSVNFVFSLEFSGVYAFLSKLKPVTVVLPVNFHIK